MGGTIALLPGWAVTQHFVQRYLAVKTLRDARRSGLNNMSRNFLTALYAHFMLLLFIDQELFSSDLTIQLLQHMFIA